MSYISSSNISIFPLSKNRPNDRSSRLFYENNIANLLRQTVDVEGFIISSPDEFVLDATVAADGARNKITITTLNHIIFNLYGYYFDIGNPSQATILHTITYNNDSDIFTSCSGDDRRLWQGKTLELWAKIVIDDVHQEIAFADNNTRYEGLQIVDKVATAQFDDEVDGQSAHYLKLCDFKFKYTGPDKDNVIFGIDAEVFAPSYQKFSPHSIDMTISKIDGKH